MVATIRNLTSSSATSEYFRQDGGYYLRKGEDAADLRAKRAEHRNASTWHGQGAVALGLHPGVPVFRRTVPELYAEQQFQISLSRLAGPLRERRRVAQDGHDRLGAEPPNSMQKQAFG